jgi:addiction module HigA family antidote
MRKPLAPGKLLLEKFLVPLEIPQYRLAKEIGVPEKRISEIVNGKCAVSADTDLRLCRFFCLSNGYWLRAQAAYDTEVAEEALAEELKAQEENVRAARGRTRRRPRTPAL